MESFDETTSGPYGETPPRYSDYPERQMYLETDETYLDDYEGDAGRYQEEPKPSDEKAKTTRSSGHPVRSTESFLNDSSPEYFHPDDYIRTVKKERTRRRRSRELIEPELMMSSNDEEPVRPKPETMRSISEDSGTRPVKPVTRRSLSHPERGDSQVGFPH